MLTAGLFEWTPSSHENTNLTFFATDSNEATSSLNVQIEMCGCENNGSCQFDTFIINSPSFKASQLFRFFQKQFFLQRETFK